MAHHMGQMFYVGERPWHGLGRGLAAPVDLETALHASGLDFTVSLKTLGVEGEPASAVPMRRAVVRDDRAPGERGRVLGVVHPQFRLLQNREGLELFDRLYARGEPVYTTGGYLKQGEIVWMQAALDRPIRVGHEDELQTYLLFSNSHDGSHPIDIRLTTVRVVCRNTLDLATADRARTRVFRHGHGARWARIGPEAEAFFDALPDWTCRAEAALNRLHTQACDEAAFAAFIARLLPLPLPPARGAVPSTERLYETRRAATLTEHRALLSVFCDGYEEPWTGGRRQDAAPPTLWGAVNAVTAWVDHLQSVDGSRFAHAHFGPSAELKRRACHEALSMAIG